jgi:hypothetical protein
MTYKICRLMDDAEDDLLADMAFPRERQNKIYSTDPLERLNGEGRLRSETCRTGVRSVVELTGSTWPTAEVGFSAVNDRKLDRVPGRGVRGTQEVMDSGLAGLPIRLSRRTG